MDNHSQEFDNSIMTKGKGFKLKPTIQLDKLHYTPKSHVSKLGNNIIHQSGGGSTRSKGRNIILPPLYLNNTTIQQQ